MIEILLSTICVLLFLIFLCFRKSKKIIKAVVKYLKYAVISMLILGAMFFLYECIIWLYECTIELTTKSIDFFAASKLVLSDYVEKHKGIFGCILYIFFVVSCFEKKIKQNIVEKKRLKAWTGLVLCLSYWLVGIPLGLYLGFNHYPWTTCLAIIFFFLAICFIRSERKTQEIYRETLKTSKVTLKAILKAMIIIVPIGTVYYILGIICRLSSATI